MPKLSVIANSPMAINRKYKHFKHQMLFKILSLEKINKCSLFHGGIKGWKTLALTYYAAKEKKVEVNINPITTSSSYRFKGT